MMQRRTLWTTLHTTRCRVPSWPLYVALVVCVTLCFQFNIQQLNGNEHVPSSDNTSVFERTLPSIHNVTPANTSNLLVNVELFQRIKAINNQETIWNQHRFGSTLSNEHLVIVIQVHNRLDYLKQLVESLTKVDGIGTSLVIFSHDYWDDDINSYVQRISALRFVQIFFPYNKQVFKHKFPGQDIRDCVAGQKRKVNCQNERWADAYGNFRDPYYTQIKHHWWWKANKIFDDMSVTKDFEGGYLYLEEDQYVLPDLIHTYDMMRTLKLSVCPECQIINLGHHQPVRSTTGNTASIGDWLTVKYNIGFVIGRKFWTLIKACQHVFCYFDDYNWDWSLYFLSQTCAKGLRTIVLSPTRVYHTGLCGTHSKKKDCNLQDIIASLKNKIRDNQSQTFPSEITLNPSKLPRATKKSKRNGGWGDPRDQYLCMHILNGTTDTNYINQTNYQGFL